MPKTRNLLTTTIFLFFLFSCSNIYNPKPKGYNRFDLPDHEYTLIEENHPFVFEISKHAEISTHKSVATEPHWLDIKYPQLNATVELTYKDLENKENNLKGVLFDSHKLTNKHNVKAYAIDEKVIKTDKGHTAAIFELEGEVPSQFQFFVTDSTEHFLRGALYFPISTKNDSLAPAIEYIKTDLMHLLNSLEWR